MRLQIVLAFLVFAATLISVQPMAAKSGCATSDAVSAKNDDASPLRNELASLRDAALADDYGYQRLAHLTDNIGPRPTGSPQAQAAVQYVGDELRKLGLTVRLEEVRVPRWIRGVETAELVEYPAQAQGATQKIVLTALGGNAPTTPEGLTAEIVVVRSFDELKALGREKVAGKVVLSRRRR